MAEPLFTPEEYADLAKSAPARRREYLEEETHDLASLKAIIESRLCNRADSIPNVFGSWSEVVAWYAARSLRRQQ